MLPIFSLFSFAPFPPEGDEDVKIAPVHFSEESGAEDAAEQAAREFLRQKESGNIGRARRLGARYARALLDAEQGSLEGESEGDDLQIRHHHYLLYSYVVNRVIALHSPDSILAQAALSVFYGDIESGSPELYRHVSDMAAFSLYILCERSRKHRDDEIGVIFADLCGKEGDLRFIEYSNELYRKFHDFCVEEIEKNGYR